MDDSHSKEIIVSHLPPNAPRAGGKIRRWLGRSLLRLMGWRVEGYFPDEPRLVIAAAPHTSNWDFVLAMLVVMSLNVRLSYLMKKEAFIWPVKKLFMQLGGIPVNRGAANDMVDQITCWYKAHDKVWVVITPEGTRSKVGKWKTGFLRIAEGANVPVCLVAWDYPSRRMYIGPCWKTTGRHEEDAEAIRQFYSSHFVGRHPEKQ